MTTPPEDPFAYVIGTRPKHPDGEERQPGSIDVWPGRYVALTYDDWLKVHAMTIEVAKKQAAELDARTEQFLDHHGVKGLFGTRAGAEDAD